ncbi:MAG: molecular chaperone DnaJ, partial [Gammaproteobacteria bacterium]|nr:molecular chaperone DnaJ [Gammaproteobacteria bacterium]
KKLDETMQVGGKKHSPQSSSWMAGVKNFFEGMGF